MADILNEQEQVDAIKQFWRRYGLWIMVAIIIVLLGLLGYRFWQNREQKITAITSGMYEQMLVDVDQQNTADMQANANLLMSRYPDSAYSALAGLLLAQSQVAKGQLSQAQTSLQWVVNHAQDAHTVIIAKIRLARVLIAQKQPQQALTTLQSIQNSAEADMVKGDAHLALNNIMAAQKAYQLSLSELQSSDPLYPLVQMKLANLPASS